MHRYEPADPAAMALTDAEATGRPAISMVLLKHTDTHRFVFYTHTTNPKGRDLATHPRAALLAHLNSCKIDSNSNKPSPSTPYGLASAKYHTRRARMDTASCRRKLNSSNSAFCAITTSAYSCAAPTHG